jgi:hypothetical protein
MSNTTWRLFMYALVTAFAFGLLATPFFWLTFIYVGFMWKWIKEGKFD